MNIAVRGGHNSRATGAVGLIDELTEDRKVCAAVVKYLKTLGHTVFDVSPGAMDRNSDLAYGVNKAKDLNVDLFVSIHFNNAYDIYDGAIGSECWVNLKNEKSKKIAERVVNNLGALGFKNRGLKDGLKNGLYEIRHTPMSAILIEVCFVEATGDMKIYNKCGADLIGKKIAESLAGKTIAEKNKYKVNYCLEFQKWYNKITETKAPIQEDGIHGPRTENAINIMSNIIREF